MTANRIKSKIAGLAAALALLGLAVPASAQQGDLNKGAALFATHCAECHSMKEGKNKKGPSLFGIFGAKAAQREGFAYSDALKASPVVWNADALSRYLSDPRAAVPGGKMKYDGMASASERADLIAYLAASGK